MESVSEWSSNSVASLTDGGACKLSSKRRTQSMSSAGELSWHSYVLKNCFMVDKINALFVCNLTF